MKPLFLGLGIAIIVVGIGFLAVPLSHYISGSPMMVADSKSGPTHVASKAELGQMILWFLAFPCLSIPLFVFYKLASVTLDMDGVTVIDGIGRTTLRARYDEIQSVGDIRQGNKQRQFSLTANGTTIQISDNIRDFDKLRSTLIEQSR